MKKLVHAAVAATLAAVAVGAHADEKLALRQVKKYVDAVACNVAEPGDYPNQWKTVTISKGDTEMGEMGAIYVVAWYADVGCAGGNGTQVLEFSVVEQSGFMAPGTSPVVSQQLKIPDINIVQLTSMTAKGGVLSIKGVIYGPNDEQYHPRKQVAYNFKYDAEERKFVAVK